MANLSGVGYFLLLLGVLVAVHEFGHFIVAKMCGVKVLKFSIGFGPKLLGFTKGETEYRISLLPLGGYVKMAGEQPHEELSPEEAKRGFLAQPPWKRMLIVAAGPAFNLIFPVLICFFVYLGEHKDISTYVGGVEPGMPAAMAGVKPGDRITQVNGEPVKTFDDLKEAFKELSDTTVPIVVERDGKLLPLTVKPMGALEDNHNVETIRRGFIGISPWSKPPMVGVPEGSPAAKAGLKTFDRVLAINGQPLATMNALDDALAKASGDVKLKVVRYEAANIPGVAANDPKILELTVPKAGEGGLSSIGLEAPDLYVGQVMADSGPAKAGLKVGDRITAVNGIALQSAQVFQFQLEEIGTQKPYSLSWRSGGEEKTATVEQTMSKLTDEMGNVVNVPNVGFRLGSKPIAEDIKPDIVSFKLGPAAAFRAAIARVPEVTRLTVMGVKALVTRKVPAQNMGGVITIYTLASKAGEEGFDSFLWLMAVISINLGVMNLLPIPILDGFGLLSAAWEGIRRRPIPMRAREVANLIGLAMLVTLMAMVLFNDAKKKWFRDDAGSEQTQQQQ